MREFDAACLVGQVVEERYRIETVLGAGGMGAVYRARHVRVGREVAIKVLHDHLVEDPAMVERFEREAAIAARLAHRNVVSVIDVGETPAGQKLMVLELVRGESLAAMIARGPLAGSRIVHLTGEILDGLAHAHAAGLVHRDLKPENVIVERGPGGEEIPRIVDFGIALLGGGERRLTAANVVLGTPAYMAPEHAQGHDVDPRCDLFALGVMVYEMLAGKLPFDGDGVDVAIANITRDPPPVLERAGLLVDPLLEAFARRLMARQRRDRFISARAARDVLDLIATHRAAAEELLGGAAPCRARGTTAVTPFGGTPVLAPRRATPVTVASPPRPAPARVATARVATPPLALAPARVATAPLAAPVRALEPPVDALAATVEAPAAGGGRRARRRNTPAAVPWTSLGLLAGAALAVIVIACLSGPARDVVRWLTEVLR